MHKISLQRLIITWHTSFVSDQRKSSRRVSVNSSLKLHSRMEALSIESPKIRSFEETLESHMLQFDVKKELLSTFSRNSTYK